MPASERPPSQPTIHKTHSNQHLIKHPGSGPGPGSSLKSRSSEDIASSAASIEPLGPRSQHQQQQPATVVDHWAAAFAGASMGDDDAGAMMLPLDDTQQQDHSSGSSSGSESELSVATDTSPLSHEGLRTPAHSDHPDDGQYPHQASSEEQSPASYNSAPQALFLEKKMQ